MADLGYELTTASLPVGRAFDIESLDYSYSAALGEWRATVATFAGHRGAALSNGEKYVAFVLSDDDDRQFMASHAARSFEYQVGATPPTDLVNTLAEMMGMPRE